MKKITSFLIAAVIALTAINVHAQPIYAPQIVASTNGSTTFTAAFSSATNIMAVINVGKQASVGIQIASTNVLGDAVNPNILYYQRSVDGVKYETALSPIGWVTAGQTERVVVTNILTYGAGYIRFPYVTNTAGSGTNVGFLQIKQAIKIGAP